MKWFKHETDAHTNLKLQNVIDTHGLGAYAYYWICVEIVGLQGENFRINSEKNWKIYLKKLSGLSVEEQDVLLNIFGDTNLVDKKSLSRGVLYIPKLEERQDEYTKRVRRVSGQSTDNVPLEEKRIEKNRREKMGEDFLSNVPLDVLNQLVEKYKIGEKGIKAKAYDLLLWCRNNQFKKDNKAFLENALRRDKEVLQNKYPYEKKVVKAVVDNTPPTPEQQEKINKIKEQTAVMLKTKKFSTPPS